jgi:hypothetical protein
MPEKKFFVYSSLISSFKATIPVEVLEGTVPFGLWVEQNLFDEDGGKLLPARCLGCVYPLSGESKIEHVLLIEGNILYVGAFCDECMRHLVEKTDPQMTVFDRSNFAVKRCSVCGLLHAETLEVDGSYYCPLCFSGQHDKAKHPCGPCGSMMKKEDMRTFHSPFGFSLSACPECAEKHACSVCGLLSLRRPVYEATILFNGETKKAKYCEACLPRNTYRCSVCSGLFSQELMQHLDGRFFCNKCWEKTNAPCSVCGRQKTGSLSNMCSECSTGYIRPWNYKPRYVFHGTNQPYYGLEIEINGFPAGNCVSERRPTGQKLKCALDMYKISKEEKELYLMTDSTIGGGFEIGVQPRSFLNWQYGGRALLEQIAFTARKHGATSYKNGDCGIHIHRSITDIKDTHKATFLAILSSIEPFVYILAQRVGVTNKSLNGRVEVSDFGNFTSIKRHFPDDLRISGYAHRLIKEPVFWKEDISSNHRSAVCLSDKKTMELRVFRGTLAIDTIMAYISLYHFLVEWSMVARLPVIMKRQASTNWKDFSEFLKRDFGKAKYNEARDNLVKYAQSKGVSL